jgi:Domain of unknown function (DUF4351)
MIDSDQLFKELLKTFFVEFLALFFPATLEYLDTASVEFPDKEYFTELLIGQRRTADIVAQAKFKEQEVFFLVHIENQGDIPNQQDFQQRQFFYAADLLRQTGWPVYSIAVLYGNKPKLPHQGLYRVQFPDHTALEFRYRVVQLNQLHWRDFVAHENPIAAALMAKMRIASEDRPIAKAACLNLLAGLKLTETQQHLISGFVDIYLPLNPTENETFEREIGKIRPERKKKAMEIVTSWEKQGRQQEALKLSLLLLQQKFGEVPADLHQRIAPLPLHKIERLFKKILSFSTLDDLNAWLEKEV